MNTTEDIETVYRIRRYLASKRDRERYGRKKEREGFEVVENGLGFQRIFKQTGKGKYGRQGKSDIGRNISKVGNTPTDGLLRVECEAIG